MTQAQQIAELKAQLAKLEQKASPKEKVPFLSCWDAAKYSGEFTRTNKAGRTSTYRCISEAEAVKLVKANVKAGRVYAVTVA